MFKDRSTMEVDDDATAKAYASLTAQLESWTAPEVGTRISDYHMDDGNDDDDDDIDINEDDNEADDDFGEYSRDDDALDWMGTPGKRPRSEQPPTPMITPKRTPIRERAVTPVMSNSASKRRALTRRVSSGGSSAFRPLRRNAGKYRRYHDALASYLVARRSVSDRVELNVAGEELAPKSLADSERSIEVDFLMSLSLASGDRSESNLWRLNLSLRQLGLAALVWDDDQVSTMQNQQAQLAFLQQIAANQDGNLSTPLSLVEELTTNDAPPLVIQRKYRIIQWIQQCMEQNVPEEPPRPPLRSSSLWNVGPLHPDDKANKPTQEQVQRDRELLSACLSYILAGRLEDARELVRKHGQSWRAAVWIGGKPSGVDYVRNDKTKAMEFRRVGNPLRFLWKRQLWKNDSQSIDEEDAIYSLLANDVESCLNNPTMRTWERGLAAILTSAWGRLEDEVLHYRNTYLRTDAGPHNKPPMDAEYELEEREQLTATEALSNITEARVIEMLASLPFDSMKGRSDACQLCTGAVLTGKSTILEFCFQECNELLRLLRDENNEEDPVIVSRLRFITHFTLYLDSLAACTTPIILDGIEQLKNKILGRYLEHLSTRPDLWQCLTLYASLLPEASILDYFPTLMLDIEAGDERSTILEQARELFAIEGLDLKVARKVVRLLFSEGDQDDDDYDAKGHLPRSDKKKCKSIAWLLQYGEHIGDALICSNMLLRQFFLNDQDDKMASGMALIQDFLPEDITDRAGQAIPVVDDGVSDELYSTKVGQARSEYAAFVVYLKAYVAFSEWKDVMAKTPNQTYDSIDSIPLDRLSAVEAQIANDARAREWRRQNTANTEAILKSANEARKMLESVLTYPGGWLSADGEVAVDDEDVQRKRDMETIRRRYLVLAVDLYVELCEETALWLSRNSYDKESALSPGYWFRCALNVATIVARDAHRVHEAFDEHSLKALLSKLAETAVLELMNK